MATEFGLYLFADRIGKAYHVDSHGAMAAAQLLLRELPKELLPNVEEWSRGQKLSDITIEGYSIPMILEMWKSEDFLAAAHVMAELMTDREKAIRQIWNLRR